MNVTSTVSPQATLADLSRTSGKAELVNGVIVPLMPTGLRPNLVAGRIFRRLADYTDETGRGVALTDNMGFAVDTLPSGRQSFSPDAAYFGRLFSAGNRKFLQGPPTLAVEARSENDYGPAADIEMAAKRADYFQAGTLVVWHVDPIGACIHVYRADDPNRATTYQRGQHTEAEPAVPGWRVAVDWVFP